MFPASYDYFSSKVVKCEEKNRDFTYQSQESQEIYGFEPIYHVDFDHQNIIVTENKILGRAILVSILDMLRKNPYTRLADDFNECFSKDHSARLFQNEERFKLMDIKAYQKCKMITQLIKLGIEDKLDREWNICGAFREINAICSSKEFRRIIVF
jgi:hypothetical protein